MKKKKQEEGFILVLCLLTMVVLSIIGIASVKNTAVELQIAGNDNMRKKTFYGAEAGALLATEVLEQNLNCPGGFTKNGTDADGDVADLEGTIRVHSRGTYELAFYLNDFPWTTSDCNITNTGEPNISYPIANIGSGVEESKVWVGGVSAMIAGGALQMAAGYEGKGKGAASGGTQRAYDIIASNEDVRNAKCNVLFGWRHVVGTEGDCVY